MGNFDTKTYEQLPRLVPVPIPAGEQGQRRQGSDSSDDTMLGDRNPPGTVPLANGPASCGIVEGGTTTCCIVEASTASSRYTVEGSTSSGMVEASPASSRGTVQGDTSCGTVEGGTVDGGTTSCGIVEGEEDDSHDEGRPQSPVARAVTPQSRMRNWMVPTTVRFSLGGPTCGASVSRSDEPTDNKPSMTKSLAVSITSMAVICLLLFIFRGKVHVIITWMETQPPLYSWIPFVVLFTSVSFPFTFGYLLLVVAAGFIYGFFMGMMVVISSVLVGVSTAHSVMQVFFRDHVRRVFARGKYAPLLKMLEGTAGIKIVVLTRLTPIPFGIQNALFVASPLKKSHFLAASSLGLLPTQIVFSYVGSTLRSVDDIWDTTGEHALMTYAMFSLEILVCFALLGVTLWQACNHLNKSIERQELQQQLNNQLQGPLAEI